MLLDPEDERAYWPNGKPYDPLQDNPFHMNEELQAQELRHRTLQSCNFLQRLEAKIFGIRVRKVGLAVQLGDPKTRYL